jgi:hypothetical protein
MSVRKSFAFLLASLGAVVLAVASVSTAFAHEVRPVGAYVLTVGWQHEPTYVGVQNAVQVFVHDSKGNAVDDLNDGDLKVAISTGTQTSGTMDLKGTYDPDTGLGIKGEYDAAILPTAPGTYTFHITGSIHGQSIDEKFSSSDSTFNDVQDPTPIEFPDQQPTSTELGQATTKLQSRVSGLVASAARTANDVTNAQNSANQDEIIAIIAGLLGLAGVGLALVMSRRKVA